MKRRKPLKLNPETETRCALQRVQINTAGYDRAGSYWGVGQPVFWAYYPPKKIDDWFRAPHRKAAKEKLRELYGDLKFYC